MGIRFLLVIWLVLEIFRTQEVWAQQENDQQLLATPALDAKGTLAVGFGLLKWAVKEAFGASCPFVRNASAAVSAALAQGIVGQPTAVHNIIESFSSWQFSRDAGDLRPLVLAFTGSTGVGKTETAWLIAAALLEKHKAVAGGSALRPEGLIDFNGADFTDGTKIASYQAAIRLRMLEALRACAGNGVVLFDEAQKIHPGTLDFLMPALDGHNTLSVHTSSGFEVIDCSKVVFLFVSDIGADAIRELILPHPHREDIPLAELMAAVKREFDRQWKGTNFGKVIDNVIPYLPLERRHLYEVLELKIRKLASKLREKRIAAGLYVSPELGWQLTGMSFIDYEIHQSVSVSSLEHTEHIWPRYGAREVEDRPMNFLINIIQKHMNPFRPEEIIHLRLGGQSASDYNACMHWCPLSYFDSLTDVQRGSGTAVKRCAFIRCVSLVSKVQEGRALSAETCDSDDQRCGVQDIEY